MSSFGGPIRIAHLSDVSSIAGIHVRAWEDARLRAVPGALPPSPPLDRRLELWNHVLGGGARRLQVRVALTELGETIGFVAAGRARVLASRFEGEVSAIYVSPEHQRLGGGRALLRAALADLTARGFRSAMAWVPKAGGAAGFFARMGATPLPDRRVVRVEGVALDEIAVAWPSGWPPVP